MHLLKAYRFRIYPTPEQVEAFTRIAGCCRFVYNLGLEQRRTFGRRGRSIGYVDQQNELPALKAELAWLKEAPSHCLQMALRHLDDAYTRFFQGQARPPRPRKKLQHDSFTFPDPKQFRLDVRQGLLVLPKFGKTPRGNGAIRVRCHRQVKGRICRVTIARAGVHWVASIQVRIKRTRPSAPAAGAVGVDRGVAVPFMTSSGEALGREVETKRLRLRERRLGQALARKQPGSSNRRKAKARLAAHKARMARKRTDAIHKVTAHLAQNQGVVAVERLDVASMTASARGTAAAPGTNVRQKSGLNRSVLDKGWGEFTRQLRYKLGWTGGCLIEVDPAYSSQTCPVCGAVDADSRVSREAFVCTACGHAGHADLVAATEILRRGLAIDDNHGGGRPLSACGDLGDARSEKQEAEAARPEVLELAD